MCYYAAEGPQERDNSTDGDKKHGGELHLAHTRRKSLVWKSNYIEGKYNGLADVGQHQCGVWDQPGEVKREYRKHM